MAKSFKSYYVENTRDITKAMNAIKQDDEEKIERDLKESPDVNDDELFPKDDEVDEETWKKYVKN